MLLKSISLGLLASLTIQASFISHSKLKRSENVSTASRWIVELNEGHSTSHDAVIRSLNEEYVNANVVLKQSFNHDLFDGFSVNIDASHENIKRAILHSVLDKKEVKSIYPVIDAKKSLTKRAVSIEGLYDDIAETHLLLSHKMSQVDRVHKELNVTGHGILIGIIDSGFDYNHPALGGGIGPDHKILFGYDIAGDNFEKADPRKVYPDNDPIYKCAGGVVSDSHGTHVATIIAGEDSSTGYIGVAPDAKLAVWRVSNCGPNFSEEAIISSMLMAYDAQVDIINMSLGGSVDMFSVYQVLTERLSTAGINVVVSGGNSGSEGVFSLKEPGASEAGFTVASVDNDYKTVFVLTSESFYEDYEIITSAYTNMKGGRLVVASDWGDLCSPADLYPDNIGGNLILVNGTECLQEQVDYLVQEQAKEIVVYSPAAEPITPPIPLYYLKSGNYDELFQADGADIVIDRYVREKTTARTVSDFSSIGPTEYLEFKPNIAAPGGPVYSAINMENGAWSDMSGTSMASPYTAGVIALYKSYLKNRDVDYIQEHLQNYAHIMNLVNTSSIDNPIKQGAGLIQAYDALTQVNHISPAQISFNDTANIAYHTQELTITNHGHDDVTYRLFNNVTITVLPYGDNINRTYERETLYSSDISADIAFSSNEITIAAGESQTVSVTVIPPTDSEGTHAIYGGFVQFDPIHQSGSFRHKALHVPYIGVLGNQRDVPILDPAVDTLMVRLNGTIYESKKPITYSSDITVEILTKTINPTHEMMIEVIDIESEKLIGYLATNLQNVGVTETWGEFTGTYTPLMSKSEDLTSIGPLEYAVPLYPGRYLFRLKALKFLGHREREEDWDTRTSVPIIIEEYVESYEFYHS
ncbi:peptidase S8/S53 domain-containing protein [Pilobolus umbonatus]|nr:peptidase S8/S53 domain-containing protein [Pilobolus umbonatus]